MQETRIIIKAADSNIILELDEFIIENFVTAADKQGRVDGTQHTYYCSIGKSSQSQTPEDEPEREPDPDGAISKYTIDAHPAIITMLQEYIYQKYSGDRSIHTYTDTEPDTATMIIKKKPIPILSARQHEIIEYTNTHKVTETAEHYNVSVGYIHRLKKLYQRIRESGEQ